MPTPAAIANSLAISSAGATNPTHQVGLSPLTQSYNQFVAGRSIGPALPRPFEEFLSGAFGPLSPLVPMPIDEPTESGRPLVRRWQYPVGWNLPVGQPGTEGLKLASFSQLRSYADIYSVVRAMLNIRKDELAGMDWDIGPTADAQSLTKGSKALTKDQHDRATQCVDFFKHVDPDYYGFQSWFGTLLEEMFVIDAVAIHIHPTRIKGAGKFGSDLAALTVVNGQTIRPLLDIYGATPRPPAPAYQQYLWGVPRADLMAVINNEDLEVMAEDMMQAGVENTDEPEKEYRADQLLYLPRTRRVWTPYGFSPIEQALMPITIGLKRQEFLLDFFTEGTIPGVYVIAGDQYVTPAQQRQLQDSLNALAGDQAWKHRVIVLPPGSKTDAQKDMTWHEKTDQSITEQVGMILHIQPHEVGMVPGGRTSGLGGKGMVEGQQDAVAEQRTAPDRKWWKETVFDYVIQDVFGQRDLEWKWVDFEEEEEAGQKAQAESTMITAGKLSIDETRIEDGLDPWNTPFTSKPYVVVGNQLVSLDPTIAPYPAQAAPTPPPLGPDGKPTFGKKPGEEGDGEAAPPGGAAVPPAAPTKLGPDGRPIAEPEKLQPGQRSAIDLMGEMKPTGGSAGAGARGITAPGTTGNNSKKPKGVQGATPKKVKKYSEGEPRNDYGQWMGEGAGAGLGERVGSLVHIESGSAHQDPVHQTATGPVAVHAHVGYNARTVTHLPVWRSPLTDDWQERPKAAAAVADLVKARIKYKDSKLGDIVHDYLLRSYPPKDVEWAADPDIDWEFDPHVDLKNINMARRPGGRDPEKVESIASTLDNGASMDPMVFVDVDNPNGLVIADGWHRTLGAEKAGWKDVPAFIGRNVPDKFVPMITGDMQDDSDSKKAAYAELAVLRRYLRKGNNIDNFTARAIPAAVMYDIRNDLEYNIEQVEALEHARQFIGKYDDSEDRDDHGRWSGGGTATYQTEGSKHPVQTAGDRKAGHDPVKPRMRIVDDRVRFGGETYGSASSLRYTCRECQGEVYRGTDGDWHHTLPSSKKDFSLTSPLSTGLVPFDLAGQKPKDDKCAVCGKAYTIDGDCPEHGKPEVAMKYSPDEARDERGRWATAGASAASDAAWRSRPRGYGAYGGGGWAPANGAGGDKLTPEQNARFADYEMRADHEASGGNDITTLPFDRVLQGIDEAERYHDDFVTVKAPSYSELNFRLAFAQDFARTVIGNLRAEGKAEVPDLTLLAAIDAELRRRGVDPEVA